MAPTYSTSASSERTKGSLSTPSTSLHPNSGGGLQQRPFRVIIALFLGISTIPIRYNTVNSERTIECATSACSFFNIYHISLLGTTITISSGRASILARYSQLIQSRPGQFRRITESSSAPIVYPASANGRGAIVNDRINRIARYYPRHAPPLSIPDLFVLARSFHARRDFFGTERQRAPLRARSSPRHAPSPSVADGFVRRE